VNLVDPSGLDSFACKVPLGASQPWSNNQQRSGPNIPGNPLHHDYLCVIGKDGKPVCGGLQPGKPVTGLGPVPGAPSIDFYDENKCSPLTKAPGSCFEKCVARKISPNAPRPPYALGPDGITCQGFVDQTIFGCMTECFIKGAHE
jgi:hypothetical protein